ncbi:MAG: hypothetical protein KatS3mg022_3163 [Armatimonadota bacterium]|nr:MAG: hypothetical protein KatS3mg022_3163 [Armatimonadota bacterium]
MARLLWRLALMGMLGWLLVGGSQAATFTLTHNGWTYSEDSAVQGIGNFVDPNSVDHMYQNWWWFRTNLDSYERPLANLVTMTSGGANNVSLVFREDAGNLTNALLIKLDYTLTGVSSNQAYVNIAWSVRNIYSQIPQPITVDFFAYSDFDLNDTAGGDTALWPLPVQVSYNEGSTVVDVIASGSSLVGLDIDNYSDLLDLLTDSTVYNVSGLTPSVSPGDMTNVFQWRATLGLGESLEGTLTKVVTLGIPPTPVIPEPGTWALMLSGLMPVALRLRKKA